MRVQPGITRLRERLKRGEIPPAIRMGRRESLFPRTIGHFVSFTHTICPGELILDVAVSGSELPH